MNEGVRRIFSFYRELGTPAACTPLGSGGGFSGARLWRIVAGGGEFCLRRWPAEHPDEGRLQFIHAVLRSVYDQGVREVALPLPAIGGATWIRQDGFLWELTRWMPGRADFRDDPRPEKLRAAMAWLAKFHLAAAPATSVVGLSPGLAQRRELLLRLTAGETAEIARILPTLAWPEFADRGKRTLEAFARRAPVVERMLAEAASTPCPLQPCIRDIWRDHVFFEGDRIAGVIDFGAIRTECVAGDIARLLGSLAGDEPEQRRLGLEAYSQLRPLDACERRLLDVFDASEVLLSGMNWLRWICLERRRFDPPDRVLARLDEILSRLDRPPENFVE
jgi:Ser/Thr protein kinase RdoA (MazF antagonist)